MVDLPHFLSRKTNFLGFMGPHGRKHGYQQLPRFTVSQPGTERPFPREGLWLAQLDLVLISGPIKEEQEVRACVITGCFYWQKVNDGGSGKGVQGISNPRKWNAE